jgi:nucleoside-triphosphatase
MKLAVITGPPGSGKTTTIVKVAEILASRGVALGGFYTREVREGGVRKGFEIVTIPDGEAAWLALRGGVSRYRVGSYAVFPENLERVGLPKLETAVGEGKVLLVDEVGPMELLSERFVRSVERVIGSVRASAFTVHYRAMQGTARHQLIERLRSAATLIEVVRFGTSQQVAERVASHLLG